MQLAKRANAFFESEKVSATYFHMNYISSSVEEKVEIIRELIDSLESQCEDEGMQEQTKESLLHIRSLFELKNKKELENALDCLEANYTVDVMNLLKLEVL